MNENAFHSAVETWRESGALDSASFDELNDQLSSIFDAADETGQTEVATAVQTLVDLLQIAQCCEPDEGSDEVGEILEFVQEHADTIITHVESDSGSHETLSDISTLALQRWNDSLLLVAETEDRGSGLIDTPADDSSTDAVASDQIDLVLSVLKQESHREDSTESTRDVDLTADQDVKPIFAKQNNDTVPSVPVPPEEWVIPGELRSDTELRNAFLDDANRCVADMESVVLDSESYADDAQRCQMFCRQLHTLKGASATVGLEHLASYLHHVEDWLEQTVTNGGENLDDDFLLSAVDSVRKQMSALAPPSMSPLLNELETSRSPEFAEASMAQADDETPSGNHQQVVVSRAIPSGIATGTNTEATVRVRAAQLDKLMDILAELVAIRNHRESRAAELTWFNEELTRCSNRLRRFNDSREVTGSRALERSLCSDTTTATAVEPSGTNAINEVSNDLLTVSRELEGIFLPMTDENVVLSQFIRHFRQELMQLRRMPIAGLFQRLKRAVRDVARTENKQVEVRLAGEETGLEQSLQERLFEPLLHMVRNAVSHGIEPEEQRRARKKDLAGTLTLHASASASMLLLRVQDDGRGLDYDALRRRGFERGLLAPGSNPTRQQLAKLIFHPGFSTRESADQVSGRGIGMDVVASTIDQMQGRIEVDSEPGSGTTILLSIPLTTGIEHVMLFRSGTQLFALPMQAIESVNGFSADDHETTIVSLADALEIPNDGTPDLNPASSNILMLDDHFGLQVEEVLGPDEAVVRAMPESLRRHPLFSGVVLAASGESVMLLNAERVNQWSRRHAPAKPPQSQPQSQEPSSERCPARKALVVDDSLSARKSLSKRLRGLGFDVTEAGDGLEALRCLRSQPFDLVTTDLDMPRMGGLELLGEIRQGTFQETPVVVVSSRPRNDMWKRTSEKGAFDYLTKPATEAGLQELIERLDSSYNETKPRGDETDE